MASPLNHILHDLTECDSVDGDDLLLSPPPPPAAASTTQSGSTTTATSPPDFERVIVDDGDDEDVDGVLSEDIQRMERAFAPLSTELEDVLRDFNEQAASDAGNRTGKHNNSGGDCDGDFWTTPTPKSSSRRHRHTGCSESMGWDSNNEDNDDDISDDEFDDELQQLAMSEQALRDELEFAADMSLLGSPGFVISLEASPIPTRQTHDAPEEGIAAPSTPNGIITAPDPEAIQSADTHQTSVTDDDLPRPVALEFPPSPDTEGKHEETSKAAAEKERGHEQPLASSLAPEQARERKKTKKISLKAPFNYTLQDHADFLKLRTEQQNGGWYYCDMTQFLLPNNGGRDTVKDYCLPVPYKKLKRLYSGLVYQNIFGHGDAEVAQTQPQRQHPTAPTPTAASFSTTPSTPADQMILTNPATPATKDLISSAVPPDSSHNNGRTPVTAPKTPATPGLSFFSPAVPSKIGASSSREAITPPAPPPTAFLPPQSGSHQQEQQQHQQRPTTNLKASNPLPEEPLPFRTISIRVRPDVLCGAIMDAASRALEILHAGVMGSPSSTPSSPADALPSAGEEASGSRSVMNSITTHVLKRQGGHLRGAVYYPSKGEERPARAYVVDIQLCTQRNDHELQRRLVVRYYHIQDDPEALNELGQVIQQKLLEEKQKQQEQQQSEEALDGAVHDPSIAASSGAIKSRLAEDNCIAREDLAANKHIRQSCSLIQRLMALTEEEDADNQSSQQRRRQEAMWLGLRPDKTFESESSLQRAVGAHLEANFKLCPSVREENKKAGPTIRRLTLPALSNKDWQLMDISWTLTSYIVDELDTRDCSYNTLSTLRFGQFPCLPTLDVHYCAQLRRLSRESMIAHLLKSAKDLEDYASSAEYNCALFIKLLEPMLSVYGIPPLDVPKAKSLDDYPLDYTPPQVACPPLGNLVMEAVNQVAAKTPTGDIDAAEAVRTVYRAFTVQDDEEQGARLGRKNAQIMDRLANMQTMQRCILEKIRDSDADSEKAANAASEFLKRSQEAINYEKRGFPSQVRPEVPLIDIKISVGASTSGRCYVTSHQIQFVTTSMPLLGSTTTTLFDISSVKFYVEQNPKPTLLNPFPNTMSLVIPSTREVVYSFRPAMNPNRLLTGLTVIQNFASEKTPSVYSPMGEHTQLHGNYSTSAGNGIVEGGAADGAEEEGMLTV